MHACTKCLNLFKGMVTFLQARLSLLLSAEICSHAANGFLFPALLFFQLKQSKPRLFCSLFELPFLFSPLLFVLHKISPHGPGLHFAVLLCSSPHVQTPCSVALFQCALHGLVQWSAKWQRASALSVEVAINQLRAGAAVASRLISQRKIT